MRGRSVCVLDGRCTFFEVFVIPWMELASKISSVPQEDIFANPFFVKVREEDSLLQYAAAGGGGAAVATASAAASSGRPPVVILIRINVQDSVGDVIVDFIRRLSRRF